MDSGNYFNYNSPIPTGSGRTLISIQGRPIGSNGIQSPPSSVTIATVGGPRPSPIAVGSERSRSRGSAPRNDNGFSLSSSTSSAVFGS